MQSFVAIDFETANGKRASACAVGLVSFNDQGELTDQFYSLLRPHPEVGHFHPMNISVHRITPNQVAEAPQWSEVVQTVADFIGNRPIVAHNMSFDGSVLTGLASLYRIPPLPNRRFCTYRLARKLLGGQLAKYRLVDVHGHYFPGDIFAHHHALDDAVACGRIFAQMQQDHDFHQLEARCPPTGMCSPGR